MGKYLLLRLAEIYCWVTAPKWVSTPYCIYIYVCISVDMLIYKRKIMCAPSREKGSHPRSSRPPCPCMVAVTILLATVRPFPPRSSRPPCPGMVAVTILVGHCAPLPANIVTPSLPGHGGCDDPWWPMCTPSRAKRNQPISSHLPCLCMGAHRKEDDFRVGCVGAGFYVFLFHLRLGVGGPPPHKPPSKPPKGEKLNLAHLFCFL